MHQLHWRRTQDQTLLLDQLVMVLEDQLVEVQVWQEKDVTQQDAKWMEDVTHKDVQDGMRRHRTGQTGQTGALEEWHIDALEQQAVVIARAVEVMEEDRRMLDTIMALTVALVPSTVLPLTTALSGPWQPPAIQDKAHPCAWVEV
ncbi:hypothetical protein Y1Q_0020234 [Alligator mississippiensis]|uniref:Uncharacterized protein n=1 Tax=Alligator mississippiensis TaxID=8496 RepID=A0A151PIG8_ALLMI|nr:hypothetical protein Y1Q_0020234 [Alligator mississippiensis]